MRNMPPKTSNPPIKHLAHREDKTEKGVVSYGKKHGKYPHGGNQRLH